jgi:hypothetical protein
MTKIICKDEIGKKATQRAGKLGKKNVHQDMTWMQTECVTVNKRRRNKQTTSDGKKKRSRVNGQTHKRERRGVEYVKQRREKKERTRGRRGWRRLRS